MRCKPLTDRRARRYMNAPHPDLVDPFVEQLLDPINRRLDLRHRHQAPETAEMNLDFLEVAARLKRLPEQLSLSAIFDPLYRLCTGLDTADDEAEWWQLGDQLLKLGLPPKATQASGKVGELGPL